MIYENKICNNINKCFSER